MKKIGFSQILKSVILTSVLVFGTLSVVAPVSCCLTEEGLEIVPADTIAPSVELFTVASSREIVITCSEKIILDNISVLEVEDDFDFENFVFPDESQDVYAVADSVTYSESGLSAEIALSSQTDVGKSYLFFGVVYDISGNSLEFAQKFCGYNENPAKLLFNEIRTTYSKTKPASEYIELYVLKGGNTYGLEVVSAANGEAKKYVFPAIEVKTGEYITVHGRILEGMEGSVADELDDDLALSLDFESCDTARDLWKEGSDKIASNTDVIVLRDCVSGLLKDAVLCAESGKTEWSKKLMTEFAEKAVELGIWSDGSSPETAVCTDGMKSSLLRSISRQNTAAIVEKYAASENFPEYIASSAKDWFVTEKEGSGKNIISGATPGFENSTNPLASD
ncbi:MAG: hypothetical protein IJ158_13085 [Treponema sp.]|nr:hypothetical protein [Treponema sp.]